MSNGPTCEKCRHWDAERLRVMPGFGEMKLQAPCREGAPARVSPWKWQWEPACPKFAPDLREYPRVFTEPALHDRVHPTSGDLISATPIATQKAER